MLLALDNVEFDMLPENENAKPVDPFEAMRSMRDTYFDSLSKVMIKAVNSEEYAQAAGAMLNGSLTITAPFREALNKAVMAGLQESSLPSRQEVVALAERFTNIEMRLDDMDAKLDRIANLFYAGQTANVSGSHGAAAEAKPPQGSRRKS
jgi:hypothetical protein